MKTTHTFQVGDKVSGDYYGIALTGTVTDFWGSHMYITADAPFTYLGIERDAVSIAPHERASFKVTSRTS